VVESGRLGDPAGEEQGDEGNGHGGGRGHRPARRLGVAAGHGLPLGEVDGGQGRDRPSPPELAGVAAQLGGAGHSRRRRSDDGDVTAGVDGDHADGHPGERRWGSCRSGHGSQGDQQDVAALGTLDLETLVAPGGRLLLAALEVACRLGRVERGREEAGVGSSPPRPRRSSEHVARGQRAESAVAGIGEPQPVTGDQVQGDAERQRWRAGRRLLLFQDLLRG